MSKAARAIPGQRVMSRLLARVSARPLVGPSPAFYARFGLDDPWASSPFFVPEGAADPFVYVDGRHYYARLQRMHWARARLLARIAEMDTGAAARMPSMIGRAIDPSRLFRSSQLANVGVNSAVMLEAPAPVEPEADERAGRFVARQGKEKRVAGWAPPKPQAERPLARALRQVPVETTVLRVVEQIRGTIRGADERSPGRRALSQALADARALPEEQQVEVARRAVRHLRGVQRRVAELAIGEIAEESSAPVRVAMARMPAAGRSRKGLRPVLSSSPALVALTHERPTEAPAPEPRAERRVSRTPVVARTSAHREQPAAPALREARTQRVTGRAGPEAIDGLDSAPARTPRRRRPTEWAATLAREVEAGAPLDETSRGMKAARRTVRTAAPVSRAGARDRVVENPATQLASSPTAYVRSRPMRVPSTRTVLAAPAVPEIPTATPTRRAAAAQASAPRRAAVGRSVAPTHSVAAIARSAPPVPSVAPTVRAAARAEASAPSVRRTSRVTAAPTAYVRPVAAEVPEVAPSTRASRASRGIVRAMARAVAVPRSDARGVALLATAPVAHARAASAQQVVAPDVAAPTSRAFASASAATRRIRIAPGAPVVLAPISADGPLVEGDRPLVSATARAATRADVRPQRDGRGAPLLASAPTTYLAQPEHPVARSAEPTPAVPRLRTRVAASAARPIVERVVATAPPADSATVRAVRRAALAPPSRGGERRAVLAAAPTAYLTDTSEVAAEPLAETAPVRRQRPLARAEARAEAPVRTDERGAVIATERVAPAREARLATAATVPSRRIRSSSPVAQLLEPARPVDTASAPVDRQGAARVRGVAPVPADRALTRRAPTARLAERATSVAEATPRAAAAAPEHRIAASRHAVLRGEAFTPSVSRRELVTAAASVLRARDRHRTVRPAMAHVANEFRWALPVQVPVEPASERRSARPATVRAAQGSASGPITRAALASVLSRVSAAVRAMERPERTSLVADAPRRALEGAVRADHARRRVARSAAAPAFTLPSIEVDEAPEAVVPQRGRPTAWAEQRIAVDTPVTRGAFKSVATPASRVVRRAFAGVEGVLPRPLERAVERSDAAPTTESVRYRTRRTAPGRFEPARRAVGEAAPSAYALGAPGVPRRRARLDAATGLVLPASIAIPEETASAAPARRGRRVAAPAAAAQAEGRAATTRRSRPYFGTLGYLSTGEAPAETAVPVPSRRRPMRGAAPAMDLPEAPDALEAEAAVPGWATRAIEGTIADRPQRVRGVGPKLATSGHLLSALARADRPEDVVRVILQSSDSMSSLTSELSAPAARLVDRIVRLGSEEATTLNATASSAAVSSPRLLDTRAGLEPSGSTRRVRRKHAAAPSDEGGSSQAMRLAKKLMNLIHLVETERKVDDVRKQVRLADTSSAAEARSGAPSDGGGTKPENVNMKALQRDVLEAVLRELELTQQRRQEDPDGRTIWW